MERMAAMILVLIYTLSLQRHCPTMIAWDSLEERVMALVTFFE
jgi:hypothetical protein